MRLYIVLALLLFAIILHPNKENFKITKKCKFPRGCPTRRTKGMWYGLRGFPKTYRKQNVGSYFHRLFPFFYASSRSPYQVYPKKILSKS
jgi:hypothetical protein